MIITTLLTGIVALATTGRIRALALAFLPVFLLLELVFFGSNATKLLDGGWMPIVLGLAIFTCWSPGKKAARPLPWCAGRLM